jgi:hypothetical protein
MIGQPGERNAAAPPDHHPALRHRPARRGQCPPGVLQRDKITIWTDATVHAEQPFDRIWVRLTTINDGTLRIQADQQGVSSGLALPQSPSAPPHSPKATPSPTSPPPPRRNARTLAARRHRAQTRPPPTSATHHRRDQPLLPRPRRRPQLFASPGAPVPADHATDMVIDKPNMQLVVRY